MQEQITKQDAIEYLLYMKHDVQAGSPVDVAIDTAIEALKETVKQPKTNADRIRQMTDDGLADVLEGQCAYCAYRPVDCKSECNEGHLKWLKQEASEDAAERIY